VARIADMLKLQRRHTPRCPDRAKGLNYLSCKGKCPFRVSGTDANGERIRETLKTRDLARASKRLAELESRGALDERPKGKRLDDAIEAYLSNIEVGAGTRENYERVLKHLAVTAADAGVEMLHGVEVELIDQYRKSRDVSLLTWGKELAALRAFFAHCNDRGWMKGNPAKVIRMPKARLPQPDPYTAADVAAMLDACDTFGQRNYERKRALAMILLLRHTALRIGDVALMEREQIKDGKVRVRTEKNGNDVCLPLPAHVLQAIRELPSPSGAGRESRYLFWSGNGSRETMKRSADRTLRKVFKKAGLDGAHAHRFRHTLVVELLLEGASFEQISEIIRSSPTILRKHYAPWVPKRQERIESLMQTVQFGTIPAQTQREFIN
jgi:site-specific recombinase XerD